MSRYAVFIDGGYIKKVLRQFGEVKISYLKLSEEVADDEERLRTYYYDCPPYVSSTPTADEKLRQQKFDRFKHALEKEARFQVRLGRLARYQTADGPVFEQKKVDVLLTVDLVKLSLEHQIQRAVLIAGDSDFCPAIQVARDAGVVVQLYHHPKSKAHEELIEVCDERFQIDEGFINKIKL